MDLKDLITSIGAIVGMALGIYNFLHARSSERVQLKVIPKATGFRGTGPDGRELYLHSVHKFDLNYSTAPPDRISLEIINLRKFAVTVDDVDLQRRWTRRGSLAAPIIPDGKDWPRRLESRESVTVQFDTTTLLGVDSLGSVKRASYGTSGALRQFVRVVREASRP